MTFSRNVTLFFKIFGEKYFEKKGKVPRKYRHWVTLLFKSRDNVFAEFCAFFKKILWRKIFQKKKGQGSPKTSSLVNTIIQKQR